MPEFEARTVKEAITRGLEALNVSQNDVTIDVLDEGRSGVLGVGAKSAVVRITPKSQEPGKVEPVAEAMETDDSVDEEILASESASEIPEESATTPEEPATAEAAPTPTGSEDEQVSAISADFLRGVLDRMGLQAGIETQVDEGEESPLYRLNITGEDLGILIGRRAETLDALQYLTRLVVNQHTHRWYRIEVDVESYKQRRRQSLQRLAQNMADRAVSENRTIVMEPMPSRERRLIHLALRDRNDVHTESVGEGDSRKVTIIPN